MAPVVDAVALRPADTGCRATRPTDTRCHVECIDSSWGFTALRPEWNALLRASATDCPFLTWEWLRTWWTHLGRSSRLRIAAVRAGNELIAIAPFRITEHRVAFLSRLDMLGTGEAGSDYLDVIVRRGWEAESVRALARFAGSQNATLRLGHLAATATAFDLADVLAKEGWTSTTTPDGVCPYIPLAGHTWESYLATLGSSHRANVRRRIKALGQKFTTRFELVSTDAQRREALAALATFHDRRYVDRGGSTAFMTPALRAFHDEATKRALNRGWLRLFVLRVNDAPAAVMYGFMYNRRFYFYQHGFDDQYQQHSIGLVVMALSIQAAIDEGADEFDMLWGLEAYKALWAREARTLRRIQLFPAHLGGRLHHAAFHARRTLGSIARRVRNLSRRGSHGS
jgi:CelD/BcsL family acetyltransferase involved in cellulose biosynthesis